MKTKKILTFSVLASIPLLAMGAIIGTREGLAKVFASDNEIWSHYSEVPSTYSTKGCREYWVSCSTHEHQFTAPSSANIVDKGAPSQSWIDSLDNDDDRLIAIKDTLIDFEEDGDNSLFSIVAGFTSFGIANGEGVDGSKALKFSRNNATASDCKLALDYEYLQAVFSDPDVKSLSFYAKGTNVTNNFRHIKVAAQYVNNDNDITHCYENNTTGWGITNEYKKFYLTRGVFSQMTSTDLFIQYNVGAGDLFIDNLQPAYTDYYDYSINSFEFGGSFTSGAEIKVPGVGSNASADFIVQNRDTNVALDVSYDYSLHTEGVRSLKITKTTQEVDFRLGGRFAYNKIPAEGIYFDYYSTINVNGAFVTDDGTSYRPGLLTDGFAGNVGNGSKAIIAATNMPAAKANFVVYKNTWYTFHILKSQINSGNGRFFVVNAHDYATSGTFYIDNIRFADSHPLDSFEDAYTFYGGNSGDFGGGASSFKTTAEMMETGQPTIVNTGEFIFTSRWSAARSVEITDERASDGHKSLKYELTKAAAFEMRYSYVNQLFKYADAKIAFDVYSDDLDDSKLKLTTVNNRVITITKGAWTTIELTKDDFYVARTCMYSNNRRFTENAFGAGTVYIDNIRLINASY